MTVSKPGNKLISALGIGCSVTASNTRPSIEYCADRKPEYAKTRNKGRKRYLLITCSSDSAAKVEFFYA